MVGIQKAVDWRKEFKEALVMLEYAHSTSSQYYDNKSVQKFLDEKMKLLNKLEWRQVQGFDHCNKCHSEDVSMLTTNEEFIPNGTEVKCNSCGNKGETTAYGNEEVVTEWVFEEE